MSVAVPHSGQNLHELDWQSLREPNLKNAVSFQYNRLGAERLFTQNIIQSRSRPSALCPPQGTALWSMDYSEQLPKIGSTKSKAGAMSEVDPETYLGGVTVFGIGLAL